MRFRTHNACPIEYSSSSDVLNTIREHRRAQVPVQNHLLTQQRCLHGSVNYSVAVFSNQKKGQLRDNTKLFTFRTNNSLHRSYSNVGKSYTRAERSRSTPPPPTTKIYLNFCNLSKRLPDDARDDTLSRQLLHRRHCNQAPGMQPSLSVSYDQGSKQSKLLLVSVHPNISPFAQKQA